MYICLLLLNIWVVSTDIKYYKYFWFYQTHAVMLGGATGSKTHSFVVSKSRNPPKIEINLLQWISPLSSLITHHWKYQLAKKKELSIPPIWGCCGPIGGSIFTPGQKNHPAFSEIAAKTHSPFGPYLAGHFACIPPALEKGWMVFLPRGKNRTSSRSTTTPDRWYQKFFFFGQLALPIMCGSILWPASFL